MQMFVSGVYVLQRAKMKPKTFGTFLPTLPSQPSGIGSVTKGPIPWYSHGCSKGLPVRRKHNSMMYPYIFARAIDEVGVLLGGNTP